MTPDSPRSSSSSMMSTSLPTPQPRGPTCGVEQCHGRGTCKLLPGSWVACECDLGYQGDFCQYTLNQALSTPLTLGVLGVIVALVMLTFILAKLRQKQRRHRRQLDAAKRDYDVPV